MDVINFRCITVNVIESVECWVITLHMPLGLNWVWLGWGGIFPELPLAVKVTLLRNKRSQWEPRCLPLAFRMFVQRSLLGAWQMRWFTVELMKACWCSADEGAVSSGSEVECYQSLMICWWRDHDLPSACILGLQNEMNCAYNNCIFNTPLLPANITNIFVE